MFTTNPDYGANYHDMAEQYKENLKKYPNNAFIATTGARQPSTSTEHRQLPWCRELWPSPA